LAAKYLPIFPAAQPKLEEPETAVSAGILSHAGD